MQTEYPLQKNWSSQLPRKKPNTKLVIQKPQNVSLAKYFAMDPAALIQPKTSMTILRPTLSERVPRNTLAMATPINVHIGRK